MCTVFDGTINGACMRVTGDAVHHLYSPRVDIDRREAVSTSAGVSQNDKVCCKSGLYTAIQLVNMLCLLSMSPSLL